MNLIDNKQFIVRLRKAVAKYPLTERERKLLSYRFGLGEDNTIHTMKECSEMFGITQERIRQINLRTIGKLGVKPS